MVIHWLQHRRLRSAVADLRPDLYRLAYAWCHDAALADDLVQEAVEKALGGLRDLRDEAALKGWLCRILANCHRDWLRRRRDTVDVDEIEIAVEDGPEQSAERARLVASVHRAMSSLNDDQRKVLTLVDLSGLSYAEVAAALELPIGTVMSRLSRAREQLRKRLLAQEAPAVESNVISLVRSHGQE